MKKQSILFRVLILISVFLFTCVCKSKAAATVEDSTYTWRQQGLTTTYALYSKTTNTYVAGNRTQEVIKLRNGNGWKNSQKHTYVYDANNNIVTVTNSSWVGGAWVFDTRTANVYDASNRLIRAFDKYWDGTASAWVNFWKTVKEYSPGGNYTKGTGYQWNPGTSLWEKYNMVTNTYNPQHQITSLNAKAWNGSAWAITNTELYHYTNSLPDTVTDLDYTGNFTTRTINEYDVNNNKVTETHQSHNITWTDTYKWLFTYDANNMLTIKIKQEYINSTWTNSIKMNFTYNGDNKLEANVTKNWYPNTSEWLFGDSTIHYYSPLSPRLESTLQIFQNDITVYPNPGTGIFNFTGVEKENIIAIFDENGKMITNNVFNGSGIDLSGRVAGIYFYSVQSGEGIIHQGKLILR